MFKEGISNLNERKIYIEKVCPNLYTIEIIDEIIFSKKSEIQKIDIIRSKRWGISLYIDHKIQFSTVDEHIYHEILVHPALLIHPNPQKILIIGGGDGGALREVLKHNTVKNVILVDIDKNIIDLVEKYIPSVPQTSFRDPRVKIVIMDGRKYIEVSEDKYDVIIVDVTDPSGPSSLLYTFEFYKYISDKLKKNGVMVTHSLGLYFYTKYVSQIYYTVSEVFKYTALAKIFVPSFWDEWTYTIASNDIDINSIDEEIIDKRYVKRSINTNFYSSKIHSSLFKISKYYWKMLENMKRVSYDKNPIMIES